MDQDNPLFLCVYGEDLDADCDRKVKTYIICLKILYYSDNLSFFLLIHTGELEGELIKFICLKYIDSYCSYCWGGGT